MKIICKRIILGKNTFTIGLLTVLFSSLALGKEIRIGSAEMVNDSINSEKNTHNMYIFDEWLPQDKLCHFTSVLLGTLFVSKCIRVQINSPRKYSINVT